MTAQEWLACTNPTPMLAFLQGGIVALVDDLPSEAERQTMRRFGQTIPRKLALFACACCRHIWPAVTDARSRKAVEVAEQSIDGLASEDQFQVAALASHDARNAIEHKPGDDRTETHIRRIAANACWEAVSAAESGRGFRSSVERAAQESADVAAWVGLSADIGAARAKQAECLRCIVGNPFRLGTADPSWFRWHDGAAVHIAQTIYDGRRFQNLPILADALEEAGCTDADILSHCRGPGEHVRGCWVLDSLLGKR